MIISSYYSASVANGVTSDIIINSYGSYIVSSGGTAKKITVNSNGNLIVSSGGTATNVSASSGARVSFVATSDSYIQGAYNGSAFEINHGSLTGISIPSSFQLTIAEGASGTGLTIPNYGTVISATDNVYLQGACDNNAFEVMNGFATGNFGYNSLVIASGASASFASCGRLVVSNGGIAEYITAFEGCEVFDGGVIHDVNTNDYGYGDIIIHSGGVATGTTVRGMGMKIENGGNANWITLGDDYSDPYMLMGGSLIVSNGGKASNITLNSGATLNVSNGATALFIRENGGAISCSAMRLIRRD